MTAKTEQKTAIIGNTKGSERFLAFGAPLILLVYAVVALLVANAISDQRLANAAISPVSFTEEIVEAQNTAPVNAHTKTVGDIDGDGLPDVLASGAAPGNTRNGLFWYRNPDWTKFAIVPTDDQSSGFSTDMQVGDVDGDGDLDVVIPRADNNGFLGESVKWFENPLPLGDPQLSGDWVEHSVHGGIAGAHDIELADLNNDTKLDIVVRFDATTAFIQGATPDDWTRVNIHQASNPVELNGREGLALGDYDDDGDVDVAINKGWMQNPFIPSGQAAVEDAAQWSSPFVIDADRTGATPIDEGWTKAFSADINQDGQMDVLYAVSERAGGDLAWYEPSNPADPTAGPWTKHLIGFVDYDHTLQVGDIDLDGDMDVLVATMNQGTDSVVIWYNLDGAGTTWDFQLVSTRPSHNMRLVDLDLDGDLDLMGADFRNSPISVWWNGLGDLASWQRHEIDSARPWRSVLIDAVDLDNDGLNDVVTGGWWYQNPGTPGGAWQRNDVGSAPDTSPFNNFAVAADFDGDGDTDLLGTEGQDPGDVTDAGNPQFVWAENNGSGVFTVHSNVPTGAGDFLQGVTAGQVTGAQQEIYLSWHEDNSPIQRLIVPADPVNTQWTIETVVNNGQEEDLSQGDIDGDLDTDLLLGTEWLEQVPGPAWVLHELFTPPGTPGYTMPDRNKLADIDGDGKLDAIVGYEAISISGVLAWYEQGGVATDPWTEHVISNTIVGPMSLDVRDMDGDGDFDVVAGEHNFSNPSAARMLVYENTDGVGGSWTEHVVHTGDEHHDGARTTDIDNDGDIDIVSIGWRQPGDVFLYESQFGGGTPLPVARADSYLMEQDTVLVESAPGVLSNDSTPGNGIAANLVTDVSDGTLALNADGSFTYTPDGGFNGIDSFVYNVSNDTDTSGQATVTITVTEPNLPPNAVDDGYAINNGGLLKVAAPGLLGNDSDPNGQPLTVQLVTPPQDGALTLNADGSFEYLHFGSLGSADTFTYNAFDGFDSSNTATVTINITLPLTRETNGLVALYSFDEGAGATVSDISGVGSALDLTIDDTGAVTWSTGALTVDSTTLISSGVAATKVINAATASNAISIEGWIKANNTGQSGPARIATLSVDTLNRNFTFGQDASKFDVRLRSSTNNVNGTPSVATANGTLTTALSHVVYTRDAAGDVDIYIDGVPVATGSVTGDFSNWDGAYEFGLANEISSPGNASEDRPWLGEYRMLAIYSEALTAQQVADNFAAGPEVTAASPGFDVDGTVSLFGVTTGSAAFNQIAPQVTLDSGVVQQTVNVASDGTFTATVPDGTYAVTASADGFVSRERPSLVISGSSVVMPGAQLSPGLVDGDAVVSALDLSLVVGDFGTAAVNRTNGVNSNIIDIDADGFVTGLDLSKVLVGFGKVSPETDW